MTRSRALNRFHRYLARRHRQDLRGSVPTLHPEQDQPQPVDCSDRLMRRALLRDQRLDMMQEEEPNL